MDREEIYCGLEPQARRPISNVFGDMHWTYVGQRANQEEALRLPPADVEDGVPIEFVRAYAMLTMNAGVKNGIREISRNVLLVLVLGYFLPSWIFLILIPAYAYFVYYSQKSYRKALALADQFYDRTIYRYEGGSATLIKTNEIVEKVIRRG
jgi:hypothetical protein